MMNINTPEVFFLFNNCLQGSTLVEHDAFLNANKDAAVQEKSDFEF